MHALLLVIGCCSYNQLQLEMQAINPLCTLPAVHKLHYDEFHTFLLLYMGRKSIRWYSLNLCKCLHHSAFSSCPGLQCTITDVIISTIPLGVLLQSTAVPEL